MLSIISFKQEEFFIPKQKIITTDNLRKLSVGYKEGHFFIQFPCGDKKFVEPYDLSGGLEISPSIDVLQKALKIGKIYLTTIGKDYKLRLGISGKGGGPISGAIVYWTTKMAYYSWITHVAKPTGAIVGATVGSIHRAFTDGNMVKQTIGGAVIGEISKEIITKGVRNFFPISGIRVKEALCMIFIIDCIERIATIISEPFTLCPFSP